LAALVSAGTLLAVGWVCSALLARRPALEARLIGSPTVIVHDGRLLWPNLKRGGLTEREVMRELRERGGTELDRVRLAVLEVDGTLSVVPREHEGEAGGGGRER